MAGGLHEWLRKYFDLRLRRLEGPAPATVGDGTTAPLAAGWCAADVAWVSAVYLAQVVGVLAKQYYDDITGGRAAHLPLTVVVLAFIVSAVSFPTVYGSLHAESNPAIRLFLAFQNGFFWQSVLARVMPAAR